MALIRRSYFLNGFAAFIAGWMLLWIRHRFFAFDSLGTASLVTALIFQFAGYRLIMAPSQPEKLLEGLEWSQWGWFFFALALPGQGPALGSAGFLTAQLLIKAPLSVLISATGLRHRFLIFFGFLALVGCLPFSSFSAYFQTFIPLMSVGDSVTSMSQKLFSGAGIWAAIVMLSVVYQSCALGYFYWSRIMQGESAPEQTGAWILEAWVALAGLLASLGLGIAKGIYGPWLRAGLHLAGVDIN